MIRMIKAGISPVICPGGVQEASLITNPKECVLYLTKRLGFVKLAMQQGTAGRMYIHLYRLVRNYVSSCPCSCQWRYQNMYLTTNEPSISFVIHFLSYPLSLHPTRSLTP